MAGLCEGGNEHPGSLKASKKDKYALEGIEEGLIGLMDGACGTIPNYFVTTWIRFGLKKVKIKEIAVAALRGFIALLRRHLYHVQ
ncbi:hypothetical protein ANN_08429 [Periplaneta americana]|uniref:Uncharacterized protein n=1 Tax=Periplaneta americana TaxID=6978 RepID=A0ABQ8T1E2_PERAM|nr:hypothetical protein ANN_08429 [Periplaneta americana]